MTGRWLTLLIALIGMTGTPPAIAQTGPLPSIQILGVSSSNGCANPGAALTVFANGTAAHSDNFVLRVGGVPIYTWTGETMAWSPSPPGGVATFGAYGNSATFPADTTVTAVISTYDGAAGGTNPTSGQRLVYQSTVAWNCTTGNQVGAAQNVDLRAVAVPSLSTVGMIAIVLAVATLGAFMRSRRPSRFRVDQMGSLSP